MSASRPKATKSLRSYTDRTLKLLWGRAAGRCALPDCRNELFVTEDGYDPVCNIGEMGHILGSSDDGPRSDPTLSVKDRDAYENLILLCRNCHGKIDGLKGRYSASRLREIKADHEAWVRTALPERGYSNFCWDTLLLRGDFAFDASTIAEALSPDQIGTELILSVSPAQSAWSAISRNLQSQVESFLSRSDSISSRVAVFPLAPVSACLYLGFLLTNRINVRAFQYHRDEATWIWPKADGPLTTPDFSMLVESSSPSAEVLFFFQLSAPIDASRVLATVNGEKAVYGCSVKDPSTGWLRSKSQLDELARKSREMFELASARYPSAPMWHVYYAGPAPGAVVVGQQMNPTVVPPTQFYEFQRPIHIASIIVSPNDSSLTRWAHRDSQ